MAVEKALERFRSDEGLAGKTDMILLLLKHGADQHKQANNGESAYFLVMKSNSTTLQYIFKHINPKTGKVISEESEEEE